MVANDLVRDLQQFAEKSQEKMELFKALTNLIREEGPQVVSAGILNTDHIKMLRGFFYLRATYNDGNWILEALPGMIGRPNALWN